VTLTRWWRRLPAPTRWLVVDVESSGLDAQRDRLLAIAAVAVQLRADQLHITPGDSFEVLLQQPELQPGMQPDKANILVHGIGVDAQRRGVAPDEGLRDFMAFAADAPLIAFHAAFDRRLIERALRDVLGERPRHTWLDLADLAPVLHPLPQAHALDDWLTALGITCAARHQAAADALATAELLLRLWPQARRQARAHSFADLQRLAQSRHWLTS
jgi:DNA polymerase III subunit epsilon